MIDAEEIDKPRRIIIPYRPREHFKRLHNSLKRFKFVCAHRRAGKTVAEFNELLKGALQNTRKFPPPRYAYVGPSFDQTEDLVWGYAKQYAGAIPGVEFSESDLEVHLPNGSMIKLYGGAAAWERMRGIYLDGAVLDEFPLLNPKVFSTVVRPCLSDYKGWAIVSGTSNGDDHFNELRLKIEGRDDWDTIIIPVTETDALDPEEVIEMTSDMSAEEFMREMMCAFDAPVEGAYYAEEIVKAQNQKRITEVPYDPSAGVFVWYDLGIDDEMTAWFVQMVGKAFHVIDYESTTNVGLIDFINNKVKAKPYQYALHIFPHDIRVRELTTGRSRLETAYELLGQQYVDTAPSVGIEDGINAARTIIPMCYFDKVKTAKGINALSNYYKKPKTGKPVHNWASHGADSFRIGAVSINLMKAYRASGGRGIYNPTGPLLRRIRGVV